MLLKNPRGPMARLAIVFGAIGLFLVGYFWGNLYRHDGAESPIIEGVLVRPARELPGFEFRDAGDLPFTANDLKGHWTLLTFGDLEHAQGHLAATRMIGVHNRLAERPDLQGRLQLVLAAERQAPGLALDFSRLSATLRVLSGEPAELRRLQAALGASPGDTSPGIDDPESPFYLVGPGGRLLALFTGAQAPASVAADLTLLADNPAPLDTQPNE